MDPRGFLYEGIILCTYIHHKFVFNNALFCSSLPSFLEHLFFVIDFLWIFASQIGAGCTRPNTKHKLNIMIDILFADAREPTCASVEHTFFHIL